MDRSARREIIGDLTQIFRMSEIGKMLKEGVFIGYQVNEFIEDTFKDIYVDNFNIMINIIDQYKIPYLKSIVRTINEYMSEIDFEEQAEELFYHIENTDYYIRRV